MLAEVQKVKSRDLVINLTFQGEAALDLRVKEPVAGTICSFEQRQTPGGGTLLGDSVTELAKQSYVAGEAFNGSYDVTVEKIWGRPTGYKATLEIIKHQGTAQETREQKVISLDKGAVKLTVTMDRGRRTTLATVPPPAALRRTERELKDPSSSDQILGKLRALTNQSASVGESGISGSISVTGNTRKPAAARGTTPQVPEKVTYQTAVPSFVKGTMDMMARTAVDPKTGQTGWKLDPVFNNAGRPAPAVTTPLIPGGN
jgi:hypothetical protein